MHVLLCFAWEECVRIIVGSMLARSTIQGMQEPQAVGRVKSIVPTFFCAVENLINNFLKAESGSKEANIKIYEEICLNVVNVPT